MIIPLWVLAIIAVIIICIVLRLTVLKQMYIYFNNAGNIKGGYLLLLFAGMILDMGRACNRWNNNNEYK
jgi:hypothetical protein